MEQKFSLRVILLFMTFVGMCFSVSCSFENSSKDSIKKQDPIKKIRGIEFHADQMWKTFGAPKMYDKITSPDSLDKTVADEHAKVAYNIVMQYFITMDCLQAKQKDTLEYSSYVTFDYDSTMLSLLREKSDAVHKDIMDNSANYTLLYIIEKTELIRAYIRHMDKLCPMEEKTHLLK